MNNQEKKTLRALVALHLIPHLGAQRIRLLLQVRDDPADIFTMKRHELETIHTIGPKTAEEILAFDDWQEADRVLAKTEGIGAELMTFWDEDYPLLLREIHDPPLLLWIKGNRSCLNSDGVAIVGTRKAGSYGKDVARHFATALSRQGLTIISGLAYGIDGAAHRATVEANGCTIAVLGSGIDRIYPARHKKLAADIIDTGGAVISEFPLGAAPDTGNFPVRNRIVSGMSLGTLVVASGIDGGSMITAKLALDQNREVFVVPHPIGTPNSVGCNSLIQRGLGKLVQSVEDILPEIEVHLRVEETESSGPEPSRWKKQDLDAVSTAICQALEEGPLHIDTLGERLAMETHQLLSALLELEMQQCVRQKAGKQFELV